MIDLRSDTVTLPTEAMWEAMRSAPLRDDTLEGDPTVAALQARAAEIVGKEDALFMASGTMGNVVAVLAHRRGGGELLIDDQAHIAISEYGGATHLAGLSCVTLPGRRGEMDLDQVRDKLRAEYSGDGVQTALVCVETSHNHSGGWVPRLDYMESLAGLSRAAGVPVHIDGARLFNAAIALGVDVRRITEHGDTVTFCLSKGLSAPMGAILAGSRDFIARARVFRRMVGGGFRQSGIMAAAGRVALETMIPRLAEDHRRAQRLWEGLREIDPRLVDADAPPTNILLVRVAGLGAGDASHWEDRLRERGLQTRAFSREVLRLVTHRHVDDNAIANALTIVAEARRAAFA